MHLERRDFKFDVQYKVKDENQLLRDIEKAYLHLDVIAPYYFNDVAKWNTSYIFNDNVATVKFTISYSTNLQDDEFVKRQVRKIVEELNIKNKKDVGIMKAVNDYFGEHFTYDLEPENSPYVPFTVLLERRGVCQGFALLALKIFEEIGLPAYYVSGYANSDRHAWNMVQVMGEWYHIDFTWNLSYDGQPFHYNYFLLSDAKILKTHDFDTNDYPACNGTRFDFIERTNTFAILDNIAYFANANDEYKMYAKNLYTNDEAYKVLDDVVQFIQVYEHTVFYSNYSDVGYLYCYDTISKKARQLTGFVIVGTKIVDNYLYVTAEDQTQKRLDLVKVSNY